MIKNRKRVRTIYRNRTENKWKFSKSDRLKFFNELLKNTINYMAKSDNADTELESYDSIMFRVLKKHNPIPIDICGVQIIAEDNKS